MSAFARKITRWLVLAAASLQLACSGKDGGTPYSAPSRTFAGVESLTPNGDGTYTLKWGKTEATGVSFSIYSRMDGRAFDFANPESRTTFFSYRTSDLRARTVPTCYLVRASLAPGEEEKNNRELCTDGKALGFFAGLDSLTKNDDGTYLLSWTSLNFTDVEYAVYMNTAESLTSFDFLAPPHAILAGSLFKTQLFSLGERHCFVVRYIGTGLPSDTNINSLCTPETPPADFRGITDIQAVSSGLIRVLWAKSDHPDVVGYRVYKGNSFSPIDIVATVEADKASALVDGLIPEQNYFFAVRSFDRYGGEDSNTVIKGPYSFSSPVAPRFEGVSGASVEGKTVRLTWRPATGSPSHYRIYMGSAPYGSSQVPIDYDSYVEEIRAPAAEITRSCFQKKNTDGTIVETCLGDKMNYAFAVRAEAGGLEEFNTASKTVQIADMGAPLFAGTKSAEIIGGALKISWNRPVGQTSRLEIRLWADGSAVPVGNCHTQPGGQASTTPGVMCLFDGGCTSAYVVRPADFAEYLERLGLTSDTAALCPNGKPGLVSSALPQNTTLKIAATAIDGECLNGAGAIVPGTICNRDDNTVTRDVNTGPLSRPTLSLTGSADSPADTVQPNQLLVKFFNGGPELTGALPVPAEVQKFRIEVKECLTQERIGLNGMRCIRWSGWTPFDAEFSKSAFTAPFVFPPNSYQGEFKAKINTEYCLAIRGVTASDIESHGIAQQGAVSEGCPYISGNTRIPAYPEFFGISEAHVSPSQPLRIYAQWNTVNGAIPLTHFKIYYSKDYGKLTVFLRDCNAQQNNPNCTLPDASGGIDAVHVAPDPTSAPRSFTLAAAGCSTDSSCEGYIDFDAGTQLAEKKFYLAVRGFASDPDSSHEGVDVNTTKLNFTVPNTVPPDFAGIGAVAPTPNPIDPDHRSDVLVSWTPVPELATYPEGAATPSPPNAHSYLVYATSVGTRGAGSLYHCADGDRPTPPATANDLRLVVPAPTDTSSGQQVRIADLPDYQAYIFRVFARSVYGYVDTNTATSCIDLADLTPPEQSGQPTVTFVPGAVRKLTIRWPEGNDNQGSGVSKYRLLWRVSAPGNSFAATANRELTVAQSNCAAGTCEYELADSRADGDGKNFADDSLVDNTPYQFLVKSVDAAGNISENDATSEIATILPPEAPPQFAGLSSTVLTTTPGSGTASFAITLQWNGVSNASGYLLYAGSCDTGTLLPPGAISKDGSNNVTSVTPSSAAGSAQYVLTSIGGTALKEGDSCPTAHGQSSCTGQTRTYTFCARAYREVGGAFLFDTNSTARTVVIDDHTSPTVSASPTLTIDHPNRRLHVAWSAASDPSGIQEYRVFLKPTGAAYSFDWSTPAAVVAAPSVAADLGPGGLQQGQDYSVVVRAVDNSPKHNVSINTSAATLVYRTQNLPQITSTPAITPASPKTGEAITCTVAYSDADGDRVIPTFTFRNATQGNSVRQTTVGAAGTTSATYVLRSYQAASGVRANADVRNDQMTCTVTLQDEQSGTASALSPSITVANSKPVIALSDNTSAQVVWTGDTLATIQAFLSDPDGDALSLIKKSGSDACSLFPATYTLDTSAPGEGSDTVTGTAPGTWSWEAPPVLLHTCTAIFQASDSASLISSDASVTVVVRNRAPTPFAVALSPASPHTDDTLTCTPDPVTDPDGDTPALTYEWRKGAVESTATALSPAETTASLAPAKTVVGETYWCFATASDGRSSGSTQNKTVATAWKTIVNRVPNVPAAPVLTDSADAGSDLAVGETATCTAGVATDPDGTDETSLTRTYQFLLEDAPGANTFSVVQSGTLNTFVTNSSQARQNLKCKVTVTDAHGGGSVSSASATIPIGNSAPVLGAIAPLSIPPGATLSAGQAVLAASDADGDSLTYRITESSCGDIFSIQVDNGTRQLMGTIPPAQVVQSAPYAGVCTVKARANDGSVDSNEITITFNISNSAPTLSCTSASLDEGRTATGTLCTASDSDPGTVLSFTWVSDGCGLQTQSGFSANVLSLTSPFNMPSASCVSSVRVTDNAGVSANSNISFNIPGTKAINLSWGTVPTLDDQCTLSIPATAGFTGTAFSSVAGYLLPIGTAPAGCRSSDYPPATAFPLGFAWADPNLGANCNNASGCYVPTFTDSVNGFHSCLRVTAANGASYALTRVLKPASALAQTLRTSTPSASAMGDNLPGRQAAFQGCLGSRAGFLDETSSKPCSGLRGFVAAGGNTSCTLVTKAASPTVGRLSCFGDNSTGQTGRSPTSTQPSGAEANLESGFADGEYTIIAAAMGSGHTCILRNVGGASPTTGQVRCFGANDWGQAGDGVPGRLLDSNAPASDDLRALSAAPPAQDEFLAGGVSAIAAGSQHTCALSTWGEVRCWGRNNAGQLGSGVANGSALSVTAVAANSVGIAAGSQHSCALLANGTAKCWGDNASGQLGDGTLIPRNSATAVVGLSNAIQLAAGQVHTCALLSTGKVVCWGDNAQGQLGNNSVTPSSSPVTVKIDAITDLTSVVAISAAKDNSCALISNGKVRCWGANAKGQVGDRTTVARSVASLVKADATNDLLGVNALVTGAEHSCALLNDGAVKCWGANGSGQLGLGSTNGVANNPGTAATLGSGLSAARRSCNLYTVAP